MLDLLQSKCNSFRLISSVINSLSFFALVRLYSVEFALLSAFSMRYYTCTVHQILIEFRKNLEEPVEKLSLQIFPQLKLNLTYTSLCKESENSRVRFVHNSIHLFPGLVIYGCVTGHDSLQVSCSVFTWIFIANRELRC